MFVPIKVCLSAFIVQFTSGFTQGTFCLRPGKICSAYKMSYLDSLSTQQPDEESNDDNERNDSQHFRQSPPIKPISSGVIPSGRGPLGSYLDGMASGMTSDQDDSGKDETDDENTDSGSSTFDNQSRQGKPASWSGEYLTNFLAGDDDARTDVRTLLTQRSIQAFMRLLEECRDPHSAKWIQEDFLKTGNLLDYHGTGARFSEEFGGMWDAPLISMTQQPKSRIIISAKRRGRGHGGWSKNNPYLKERWVEMPIDIDPTNLASRILAVREQIAGEWVKDIDILVDANNQILEKVSNSSSQKIENIPTKSDEADQSRPQMFERTAAHMLNNNARFAGVLSSPSRRSNFDLLYNLCTQAAIHRILREKKDSTGAQSDSTFAFLRYFYTLRAEDYFDGDLNFGRADDFLDELLQNKPTLIEGDLVDPVKIAETIIQTRNKVADDWKALMTRVPEDHTPVRQYIFSNQMQVSSSEDSTVDRNDSSAFQ